MSFPVRLIIPAAFMVAGCTPQAAPLRVERAVIARTGAGAPYALFFTAVNTGETLTAISDVVVSDAGRSTIQTTSDHRLAVAPGGISTTPRFTGVDSVPIASRGEVRFAPGGFFVSIDRITRQLARGDSVQFLLYLSTGARLAAVARVLDYADLDTALAPAIASSPRDTSTPTAAAGLELYQSNGCASCHGPAGHGDGPVGATLSPAPRDFRVEAAFRNGSDVDAVTQTLATGIPNGGQMPLYAHLTDTERRSLALYVISLRKPR